MAEGEVIQDKVDQTSCSVQDKHQPIQFFQRFSSEKLTLKKAQVSNGGSTRPPEELDLNLRLSLGGIYSEKTIKEKPLTRSSSVAGEAITLKKKYTDDDDHHHQLEDDQPPPPLLPLPKSFLSLARSCSLPAEVEMSNKRVVNLKELRIMRRVEAKKRAVEKQRNAAMKSGEKVTLVMEGPPSSPTEIPAWAAASAAKSPALNRAIDKIKEGFRKLQGLESSGTPKGSSYIKSSYKPIKAELEATSNGKFVKLEPEEPESENPTKKAKLPNGCIQGNGMDVMKKMPSVTTTGDGPNGRKIEGFLYKYMKGQVSIVCLCHGSFLSPEEFVKHAGGKDVTNPMKHINVCSTFFSL